MKKILLLSPRFPPHQGGASTYYSTLVEKVDQDVRYFILTRYHKERNIIGNFEGHQIIRIVPLTEGWPSAFRLIIESLIAMIASFPILVKADKIHTHSTCYPMPGVALLSALLRVPILYDCRDEDFPAQIATFGYEPLWFSCAKNITERLIELNVKEEDIIEVPVINPPYVSDINHGRQDADNGFNIIFVGSVREHKGIFELIEAFSDLSTEIEKGKLKIVGDGVDLEETKQAVVTKNITESVEFTGYLPHKQTLKEISKADILVLPSQSEGRPRTVIEAIEVGTIVVATPVGEIGELIEDNENGLIIEPTSEDIRKSILEVYHNNKKKEKLENNIIETNQSTNWVKLVENVTDQY